MFVAFQVPKYGWLPPVDIEYIDHFILVLNQYSKENKWITKIVKNKLINSHCFRIILVLIRIFKTFSG